MILSLSTAPSALLCWLHCHLGFSFILPAWPCRWKENSPFPQLEPKSHGSLPLAQRRSHAHPCPALWQRNALIGQARIACSLLTWGLVGWLVSPIRTACTNTRGRWGDSYHEGCGRGGEKEGGLPATVRGVLNCIRVGKKGGDRLRLPSHP